MNLKNNPTIEDLINMIAQINDFESDHIIWVDNEGNVRITSLPDNLTSSGWTIQNRKTIKFRFETFTSGNGYLGKNAVQNTAWLNRLYNALINNWSKGIQGYIDKL